MNAARELGMQTFDQSLFDLYEGNHVTYEDALQRRQRHRPCGCRSSCKRARPHVDLAAGTEHMKVM